MKGSIRFLAVPVALMVPSLFAFAQAPRTTRDLQVLYAFDEGQGAIVRDQSGTGTPMDLAIDNPKKTKWSRGYLTMQNETVLRSSGAANKLIDAIRTSRAISMEAWIKPANATQTGPARIISLSADTSNRNVTLGQQGDAWDVRLRTSATDRNGLPSVTTTGGALKTELTHVVYTRDSQGAATIFINGAAAATGSVDGDLSNWDANAPLLIANEATGDRAWLGELHLVAIYSRALSPDEVQQNFAAGTDDHRRLAELLPTAVARPVDFVQDVQPIFREYCFECHADGNEESGLNLALKARVMEGGEHGAVLAPGNSLASPLVHLVAGVDPDRVMPPADNEPLNVEQVGVLRAWIDQGAKWPPGADVLDPRLERAREHWAFQRIKPLEPPSVKGGDVWSHTDIDAFVAEQLTAKRFSACSALPARALARRIYFDLIGLPPTPEQTAQFLAEFGNHPLTAAQELIDRLLDSRHYGERWGRYWLDLARYADSDGQESDRDRPHAYHYRDFVIRVFNNDMPFDQFVRWQIAGDEYEPHNSEAVAATGFLTGGPNSKLEDTFLEEERLFNRYNELDDVITTLGTSLLGLTVGCARCHDHKYDAFSAREYYRLLSVFHSGDRQNGKLPNGEEGLFFQDFDSQVRTSWLFRRSDFYDRELEVQLGFPAILTAGRDAEQYWAEAKAAASDASGTLQRRALADWMTDVEHGGGPLLARVIVNRIWQHHFGHGLVRTESDFGVRSEPPTHPELLEYLAQDFVSHGWKIKRLHRKILNSAVWQQGSEPTKTAAGSVAAPSDPTQFDPENRFLWKMPPRRLEAEVLRDAMLAVSGTLNLQPYGPGFKPYIPAEANLARNIQGGDYPKDAEDNQETRRRSVYMFHKRLVPYPLFQAFDRPDFLVSCARRQVTTVAPQAMALLNDRFVRDCAGDFAERLIAECGNDDQRIVQESFELALNRLPTASETQAAIEFIRSQCQSRQSRQETDYRYSSITDYCQSLFGLNEFIYVD